MFPQQVVSFDFCGIAISCQAYFRKNSQIRMDFVDYLQTWSFNLTAGVNKIQLNVSDYKQFPPGSMILWTTNDGAQLGYEPNPLVPDLLWINQTVSNMTDEESNSTSFRIYFQVFGQAFSVFNVYRTYNQNFPNPGLYNIVGFFAFNNYTTKCLINVTEGWSK